MSSITITNVDPGEGEPLEADHYLAVWGGQSTLDLFYPVGTTYKTYDTTFDPNVLWGGVWSELPTSDGENMVVTRFEFDGKFDTSSGTVTKKTNKGTTLTFGWGDYGMCMAILDGADDVRKVRVAYSIGTSSSITANYGVYGLSSGTIWTNWTGLRNGSGGDGNNSYSAEGPEIVGGYTFYIGTLCDMSNGSKTHTIATVDCVRRATSDSQWVLQGQMSSAGSGSFISFSSEVAAFSASAVPVVYQRGMQSFSTMRYVFDVYEPISGKDYKIWKRIA